MSSSCHGNQTFNYLKWRLGFRWAIFIWWKHMSSYYSKLIFAKIRDGKILTPMSFIVWLFPFDRIIQCFVWSEWMVLPWFRHMKRRECMWILTLIRVTAFSNRICFRRETIAKRWDGLIRKIKMLQCSIHIQCLFYWFLSPRSTSKTQPKNKKYLLNRMDSVASARSMKRKKRKQIDDLKSRKKFKSGIDDCSESNCVKQKPSQDTRNPLAKPLAMGWTRILETIDKKPAIVYQTPCGLRLSTMKEVHEYLRANKCTDLAVDHFTFDVKIDCEREFVSTNGIVLDRVSIRKWWFKKSIGK